MNVYHVIPPQFIGETLYPLNALKETLPDIYAQQVQKYRGREDLLQTRIPYLNCFWNDVLHFCPVHPAKIRDAITRVGFPWTMHDWFEVDPVAINFSPDNTVIYTHPARPEGDFQKREEDFIPFGTEYLEMLNSIPQATHEYFNHAKAYEERPFLFNFVPHVLHLGTLDVTQPGVRRIQV